MPPIRIATRGSKLALWQAHYVRDLLTGHHPHLSVEIITIKTSGDQILDTPLYKVGGKGLFLKEIEEALLQGRADLAVHSLKDVPYSLPEDLMIAALLPREDARDAWISREGIVFESIPPQSRVGTSSLRRKIQLERLRPDLQYISLRGNVDTRLQKLKNGEFDAILLAAAGLHRLGLASVITQYLDLIPCAGQGAIGIEIPKNREDLKSLLAPLHCPQTALCVAGERAFLEVVQGGCDIPVACHVKRLGEGYQIRSMLAEPNGTNYQEANQMSGAQDIEITSKLMAASFLSYK